MRGGAVYLFRFGFRNNDLSSVPVVFLLLTVGLDERKVVTPGEPSTGDDRQHTVPV